MYKIQKLILCIRVEIKYLVCPKEPLEEGKTVMFKILAVLLVMLSACVNSGELHTAVDESGCPPWTYRPNSTSPCQCGSSVHGTIQCNITTDVLSLQSCSCVTHNSITNESVAGYCLYSCIAHLGEQVYQLPMNRNNFTDLTCGVWKREGPLCSKCIQGYGIPLYSYDLKCVNCSSSFQIKEVFKFLAVSLIPPTVLCIVVAVLHLNVLRPPWSVFVLAAQVLSTPVIMQSWLNYANVKNHKQDRIASMVIATIYGPWNLDFFRALYKPTCISPSITTTQSYAIEGAIGLYPLVMLVVMYSFVTLRDRGCSVIVKIWKPFNFLLSRFHSKLNLKTSLIDTFATFLLLSYMKIGFAAFYVLTPTPVWSPDGSYRLAVYMDPSITYFGSSHIGYAVITLLLVFVVLIIPIILLFFYPCRCFHKCLNHFHLLLLPLHAFVDAFQGYYKDGTNGAQDCRYFSGFQLVLRLLFPIIFFLTKESMICLFSCAVVFSLYITHFVLVQPYKNTVYNKTDVPLLMSLLFILYVFTVAYYHNNSFDWVRFVTSTLCVCAPLLYLVIWSALQVKHIITHRTWCRKHTQETDQLLSHVE